MGTDLPILQLPTQKLRDGLTAQGTELASGPVLPEVSVALPLTPSCLGHVSCSQNLSRSLFCLCVSKACSHWEAALKSESNSFMDEVSRNERRLWKETLNPLYLALPRTN